MSDLAEDHFNIGDLVMVNNTDETIKMEMEKRHGKPPYTITSINDKWVRVNNESSGTGWRLFDRWEWQEPLVFVEKVAETSVGFIYRFHGGKYRYGLKKDGHNFIPLPEAICAEVDEYLKSRKPFDDKLFTV